MYLTLIITLPERFQIVNGDNYWMAGLHLFPMLGGTALGCFINGPINAKKNRTSLISVISCVLILAGASMFCTLRGAETTITPQYGFQVVFGLGVGLYFSAATMMSVAQAHKADHAVAQGAIAQARVLGGAIGLAVATIILNDHIQDDLVGRLSKTQVEQLHQSPLGLVLLDDNLRHALARTYAQAFATTMQVVTAVSGVALLTSLFTLEKNPPPINGGLPCAGSGPSSQSSSEVKLDEVASEHFIMNFVKPTAPEPTLRRPGHGKTAFALEQPK